ncbi:ATP-binding protein [Hallella absiana]|uniref:ATP-binding protein n=1 Tax=Hallella absiana TaxID=2925336 RepID=UPI003211BBBE
MMIVKDIFKTLIKEGQELLESVELNERPFNFEENGRYVLVGIRQAGKSYMLYQRAKQLLREGTDIHNIVYIDFDDERLLGFSASDFDSILQAYYSVRSEKPILFFDEIQNVDGWEHFARRLANQKYRVFITGSNARMLSRDISTTLGGRYLDDKVLPYSFGEYLGAKGIRLDDGWEFGRQKNQVQQLFRDYFYWGGFPELLLYKNKRGWLNSLYEKIILGDVIQRNGIKNEQALRLAVKKMAESVKQPMAYNRLANMVKSTGVSTNTASMIDYMRYVRDACLMFTIENFESKFVEKETNKKHYFMDNGLLNIFLTDPESSLLENICAIDLFRRYGTIDDNLIEPRLYFYNRNIEVDFYIPEEDYAVQVSFSLSKEDTKEREVKALVGLNKLHPLKKADIVTFDEEYAIDVDELRIDVIPVWKWLLRK